MNRFLVALVFLGTSVTGAPQAKAAGLSAKEIMTKNEEVRRLRDLESSAELNTGGGGSPDRAKSFTWSRKLTADGVHNNTLTRFYAPAEVRGESILFLERTDSENEVMLYLPAFKKIRRVESQQQSGSFMGSEFSYSDIATQHVDDHTYKMLGEEKCPTSQGGGLKCSMIETKPARDSVKERTGYSKTVVWVRTDNFMVVQGEYYDLDGALFKRMQAQEIREIDPKEHKYFAHDLKIENLKTGRHTRLQFSKVRVNQGIADSIFTQQNLSKGR